MTSSAAFALRRQVDLQIALLRLIAKVGVTHKTIEIEGSGRARVRLNTRQLRQVFEAVGRS